MYLSEPATDKPLRKVKWTLTVKSLALEDVHRQLRSQMHRNVAIDIGGDKPEPLMGYVIQPLSVPMLSHGDNALGLSADDGPILRKLLRYICGGDTQLMYDSNLTRDLVE